jgi:hypothetical protein
MNQAAATIRPTMQLTQRIRNLALAAAASVAILAVPATQAHADDNVTIYTGPMCLARTGPHAYQYFLPGAKVTDVNGNKWVCGPDGKWFRDLSSAIKTSVLSLSTSETPLSAGLVIR